MNAPGKSAQARTTTTSSRRALRAAAWSLVAPVVVLGAVLLWIFNTRSGAGFALGRAQSALDGKLDIGAFSGTLSGPLQLDDLHYADADAGIDARIGKATIDLDVLALVGGRIELGNAVLSDVDIALTTPAAKPEDPASALSLAAPIDILINQLVLERATIRQAGNPVLVVDRLDLVGGWTQEGVLVRKFSLRSPDGSIDLSGTLGSVGGYLGNAETTFAWRAGDTDLAGVLTSRSDGKQARLDLSLSKPMPASATMTIGQTATSSWNLLLDVPAFPAQAILPDSTLGQLAVHLQGSGDRERGNVNGTASVNDHPIALDPLRYAFSKGIVTIESMHLTSPGSSGALDLSGTVEPAATPLKAHLKAIWQGVELPEDLVGQALVSHGELALDGSPDLFAAKGSLALGPADALADIDIDIAGTPQAITLNTVRLRQASGGLDATGTVSLQPTLGWEITATANHLDPGAFVADWPGAIDFVLATAGTQTAQGPDASFLLDKVGGSLRGKPLSGSADLHLKPGYIVDGNLLLKSGGSTLAVEGSGGSQTDARLRFDVASLGDWLPASGGEAHGNVHISGQWPRLDIDGDASGRELTWSGVRVDSMELVAKVKNTEKPAGAVTLKAENVTRGDIRFASLVIEGDGNEASHQLKLDAEGTPASVSVSLSGGNEKGHWQGQLKTLRLDPSGRNLPDFDLEKSALMAWDGSRFDLAESCLVGTPPTRTQSGASAAEIPLKTADVVVEAAVPGEAEVPARLCIGGSSSADGSLAASYRLDHLPLRLLVRLAAPDTPVRLRGELGGSGELRRDGKGPISGNAHLVSDKGDVFYVGDGNKPVLSYRGFTIEAALTDASSTAVVRAALDHDGRIDGRITLTPDRGASQVIAGNLELDLNSLTFLELLSSELTNTQGRLSANYAIAGTLAEPRLNGMLDLEGFATEIPSAGLKLHDGRISLRAADARRFALDGTILSGDGRIALSGEGGLGADEPLKIAVKGEDFLAADIPAARVVVSPDLSIERNTEGILVTGKLAVPSANVDLAKLPGGGASAASPDVVIVDAMQAEPGKQAPVTARVTVSLGDEVKLAGYGFDGSLSGDLILIDRPGRATTASGTLNAGGTYKAYGQDLKIETGRILFASSPIDNPGIDIRATRTIKSDNVTAGLLIRGTAQVPVLTVFSDPSLEQSEALSYLVTGKPLSSLKSGEGDMLGTAARALGTAGGDLLAKSVGRKIGVDDIGVADNDALGGAAFTVGKYLSPKLYLSYGVGVFDPGEVVTLRYLFSRRWNFEAQNATTGSRAGFNYRYEK